METYVLILNEGFEYEETNSNVVAYTNSKTVHYEWNNLNSIVNEYIHDKAVILNLKIAVNNNCGRYIKSDDFLDLIMSGDELSFTQKEFEEKYGAITLLCKNYSSGVENSAESYSVELF